MQIPEEEGIWEIGHELVFIFISHKDFFYLCDFCLAAIQFLRSLF